MSRPVGFQTGLNQRSPGKECQTHVVVIAVLAAAAAGCGHDDFAAEDEIPVGPAVALSVNC